MDRTKVILFGMTGFGNNALKTLLAQSFIETVAVFTPERIDMPFPYYACEELQVFALKAGVSLYEGLRLKDETTCSLIETLSPDMIVVGSFNQLIPRSVISIPRFGVINVHPSLLPRYRGATPTVWVLLNGEGETGVTVHFIEDERMDSGRIVAQDRLKIEPSDTDGILRFKLARLSERTLGKALSLVLTRDREMFPPQNEAEATCYPKRTLVDAEIRLNRPFKDIFNRIRAMSPYPGAYLKYNGRKCIVRTASLLDEDSSEDVCKVGDEEVVVKTLEGMAKFQVLNEKRSIG